MKWFNVGLTLALGLMLAAPAGAQPGRMYDPQKVVTVEGQVEKIETMSRSGRRGGDPASGRQTQIVRLKTAQGTVLVHLGPAAFLEQQQFAPQVGSTLRVTGAKLTTGQGDVILAAEVQSGGKTITLRDAQGNPLWPAKSPGGRQRFLSPTPQGQAPPQ